MHYRQKITSYLSLPFTVAELLKPYHPDLQGLKRLPWTLIGSFNVNAGEERGGFALKWPQNFLRSVGFLRSKDRPRRIVDGGKATRVAFGARARGGDSNISRPYHGGEHPGLLESAQNRIYAMIKVSTT